METLTERLNFIDLGKHCDFDSNVMTFKKYCDFDYYLDFLKNYCELNNIDLSSVTDSDFDSAVITISGYGESNPHISFVGFWID